MSARLMRLRTVEDRFLADDPLRFADGRCPLFIVHVLFLLLY